MKNANTGRMPPANAGITTLITVLILLCLVTFACLSYAGADADKKLSDRLAQHSRQYYDACNEANIRLSQIALDIDFAVQNQNTADLPETYAFSVPVDESHALFVVLTAAAPAGTAGEALVPKTLPGAYRVTRFEVAATRSWDGEAQTLPLQTKGNE